MPEKDCWGTVVELQHGSSARCIPVLVYAAVNDCSSLGAAIQLRAKGTITKPINEKKLVKTIARTLGVEAAAP